MTRRTKKILLRILLWPVFILLLLTGIAVGILYSQQQRLVHLAVGELNKQLPGKLDVSGSDISAFQNFPYVSIGLKNVRFYPTKQTTTPPIYEAERMFVGFSLPDILKGQYHVRVIVLKNGRLDLVQDSSGKLNIVEASRITPDTTASADTARTPLDLAVKKIVLKNMRLSFLDRTNGRHIEADIERVQSAIQADDEKIEAQLQGKWLLDIRRPGDTTLFRNKHLQAEIGLSFDRKNQQLRISETKLHLEEAVFNITGTADLQHENRVDLSFSGDRPDFKQLIAFAPAELAKELKHFRYDGRLTFQGRIKGPLDGKHQPHIELDFSCANAWLHNTAADKKLDSVSFKGYYTNGAANNMASSELRLLDIKARPGGGVFTGNFVIRDFADPKVLMQVNSELELGFIGAFLGIKDLQRITGHIDLKMNFKELVDLSLPQQSMGKLTEGIQSELTVKNLTFRIPSFPHLIEKLDLHAVMKDGFLKLDWLTGSLGNSDFRLDGSLTDLPALFHHQEKPVRLTLNAHSNKLLLREILAFDSARSEKAKEEIYGFNIGLSLETSVHEITHPSPLPRGKFTISNLNAAFLRYPHAFHDFGAELTIGDTSLLLRNFAGNIDSSDIRFSGRVNNYALWFEKIMRGRTQVAFDLKSRHLAMHDLLGRKSRQYVPKDYQEEVASNLWLRSKIDLRYDSSFRFANIKIANISGELRNHDFRMDSVNGNVKLGIDHFIRIDTLKGRIGNSDFDVSMRLYTGKDSVRRAKENYLHFASRFLDLDQLSNYRLTAEPETPSLSDMPASGTVPKPSAHAGSFNIFQIPFIDFNATVDIGKIKFRRLWIKNANALIRMQANQQLWLDTLNMEIAEGKISARAHFNGADPQKIYLRSRLHVHDVNIEKMMLKLDYLGQDYVINKNIKGRLSGEIKTYVQVYPDLTPLLDHSEAQMDISIVNGTLVNFAPMRAMSSYFKDKNLGMVRFDTLQNHLTFKDGALTIPAMNINSSLGFMEISGRQAMDMQMEYYVRIPLKMVTQVGFRMLFGKRQEEVDPDQVDAIEYRDKEKKIRFMNIRISGTPDAYKIGLGKQKKDQH